jgi:hypothetical protein
VRATAAAALFAPSNTFSIMLVYAASALVDAFGVCGGGDGGGALTALWLSRSRPGGCPVFGSYAGAYEDGLDAVLGVLE